MPSFTKVLYNRRTVTDVPAFKYYREKEKHRDLDIIRRREDFSKIVRMFYRKVGDKMIDNPNGVFIRGFGYFVNVMNPIKEVGMFHPTKKLLINPHTDGRMFYPLFLPITRNRNLRLFVMDGRFAKPIRTRLSKELKKKKKYFNHYGILNSMFKYKD